MDKKVLFEMYRYQLLPIDRYLQMDLLTDIKSIEDLINEKNNIFDRVLSETHEFKYSRTELETQKIYGEDDFFLFQIAVNKNVVIETRDFKDKVVDSWPKFFVAVWNKSDKQYIAVQKKYTAFKETKSVVKLIFESLKESLKKHHLTTEIEPMFESKMFWDMVNRHEGKIKNVKFEFITPNMANISSTLSDELKSVAKMTNSTHNSLKLESNDESSLKIDKENESLNGLIEYSSEGGGEISIKVKGMSKRLKTSNTVKEISIDEATIQGNPETVVNILKAIME
ncbi:MAG: hypothetical protein OCC49_19540 [Fibrobacterales bacterium]